MNREVAKLGSCFEGFPVVICNGTDEELKHMGGASTYVRASAIVSINLLWRSCKFQGPSDLPTSPKFRSPVVLTSSMGIHTNHDTLHSERKTRRCRRRVYDRPLFLELH